MIKNNIENEKSLNEFYKKFFLCNENKVKIFSYNKYNFIKTNYNNIYNIFKKDYKYNFYFNENEKYFKIMLIDNEYKLKYSIKIENVNTEKLFNYLENENKLNKYVINY